MEFIKKCWILTLFQVSDHIWSSRCRIGTFFIWIKNFRKRPIIFMLKSKLSSASKKLKYAEKLKWWFCPNLTFAHLFDHNWSYKDANWLIFRQVKAKIQIYNFHVDRNT